MKKLLKKLNIWYDKQEQQLRFILMLIIVVPALLIISMSGTILSVLGMTYLIGLLVIRWAHINGKLNG